MRTGFVLWLRRVNGNTISKMCSDQRCGHHADTNEGATLWRSFATGMARPRPPYFAVQIILERVARAREGSDLG